MKRSRVRDLSCWLVVAVLIASGCSGATEYPNRPVTEMVVPWAAGGGTDAVAAGHGQPDREGARQTGQRREPHRGQRGRRTSGDCRRRARTAIRSGIITVEIAMMHHQGLTDLTGASFTPLGLDQSRRRRDPGAADARLREARGT